VKKDHPKATPDEKTMMFKRTQYNRQSKAQELAFDEFKRFKEWQDVATLPIHHEWSWLCPLSDKELKQLADKIEARSIRKYIEVGTFEDCGCFMWKGQVSNRSGVPEFRRKDYAGKTRTRNPAKLLYHFHREKCLESNRMNRLCENTRCCNPYHYEFVTNASTHKRRRVK